MDGGEDDEVATGCRQGLSIRVVLAIVAARQV